MARSLSGNYPVHMWPTCVHVQVQCFLQPNFRTVRMFPAAYLNQAGINPGQGPVGGVPLHAQTANIRMDF